MVCYGLRKFLLPFWRTSNTIKASSRPPIQVGHWVNKRNTLLCTCHVVVGRCVDGRMAIQQYGLPHIRSIIAFLQTDKALLFPGSTLFIVACFYTCLVVSQQLCHVIENGYMCSCVCRLKVHVIGDITGGLGFPGSRLYARFKVVCNTQHWHVMHGTEEGYTQVDETSVSRSNTLLTRLICTCAMYS